MPAPNERFHASGGAVSSDTEQVIASFALVPTSTVFDSKHIIINIIQKEQATTLFT